VHVLTPRRTTKVLPPASSEDGTGVRVPRHGVPRGRPPGQGTRPSRPSTPLQTPRRAQHRDLKDAQRQAPAKLAPGDAPSPASARGRPRAARAGTRGHLVPPLAFFWHAAGFPPALGKLASAARFRKS